MYKNPDAAFEALIHFYRRVDAVIDDVLLEATEEWVGENKIECVGSGCICRSQFDYFICVSLETPATRHSTELRESPGAWNHLSEIRVVTQKEISALTSRRTSTHESPRRKYVNTAFCLSQGNETLIIDVSVPVSHMPQFKLCEADLTQSAIAQLEEIREHYLAPIYSVRLVLLPHFEEIEEASNSPLH